MADGDGNDCVKIENVTRDMINQQENNSDLAIIHDGDNNQINNDAGAGQVAENPDNNDGDVDAATAAALAADEQRQKYQPSKWESFFAVTKSLIIRSLIIYFITSFFRRPTPDPNNTGVGGSGVQGKLPASNIFDNGTLFDLYIYLSELENFNNYNDNNALIWHEKNIIYGDWYSGDNNDGTREFIHTFTPSKQLKNNGSIFIHVYAVKSGTKLLNNNNNNLNQVSYSKKMLNKYKKIKYQQKHNLLTGETTASEEEIKKAQIMKQEIVSHWHPNITINMVTDWTNWIHGQVAPPLDEYIEFTNGGNSYKPVLFFNDFWNMNRDYQPLNDTIKQLEIRITYQPLSLFKWQLYSAQSMRNKWTSSLMGDVAGDEDDSDQDTLKETILETNIYLLGATIFISVLHSIFEFLAFKNDIQFWNNRKSLEGLSVRSVFFNVFQSLIVLLYVLDNESNTMIRISCGIGLCIEIWKINKVVDIGIDRVGSKILGIIPRITLTNKSSYTESSTKQYDKLAFRYLSWALYPLLGGYALYSLMYLEHKGWYSWVLNMLYGFLLTFGFIMMTPQLFINYKLKSVAHLPWRMMSYKFLNTFIDDIFAFVIKMPTLYRLGCFRDDIVFFIFLYQRWIYKIDLSRVNEFGFTGEAADSISANPPSNDDDDDDDNNAAVVAITTKTKDSASKKTD
ncbi:hypothetical protein HCN44_003827 [Aphidius gifuensis]|uniref:Uncharacterized protein n=1 Tax=Aphidius gifuensis TaxID=684658 RepID=A0A835CVG7_APHGI|nr:cleft lip and palate transmembrane protein 1 homolog [Aphidius gifuensis]KAF7994355.1 hypothetical protein HCN44_003827 [Aphidius gifuensis]